MVSAGERWTLAAGVSCPGPVWARELLPDSLGLLTGQFPITAEAHRFVQPRVARPKPGAVLGCPRAGARSRACWAQPEAGGQPGASAPAFRGCLSLQAQVTGGFQKPHGPPAISSGPCWRTGSWSSEPLSTEAPASPGLNLSADLCTLRPPPDPCHPEGCPKEQKPFPC